MPAPTSLLDKVSPLDAGAHVTAAAFVGYRWNLVALDDSTGHLVVPSTLHPRIEFAPDGTFGGDDTVNGLGGRYRVTAHGYSTADILSSSAHRSSLANRPHVWFLAESFCQHDSQPW